MLTMGQGEALKRLGFGLIRWEDTTFGLPYIVKEGMFNPETDPAKSDVQDLADRYKWLTSLQAIHYPVDQYTGSHAGGLNSQVLGVAGQVLSARMTVLLGTPVTVVLDNNAQLDFDLVRRSDSAATAYVANWAVEMKLLEADPGPTVPVSVPVTPTPQLPPVDPAPGMLAPLSPARVRVEELRSLFPAIGPSDIALPWLNRVSLLGDTGWKTWQPFAIEALRVWRRLRTKLGDARVIPAEDR